MTDLTSYEEWQTMLKKKKSKYLVGHHIPILLLCYSNMNACTKLTSLL